MDNRFLLWASLGLIFLMIYQTWQRDYGPQPVPVAQVEDTAMPADAVPPLEPSLPSLPGTADTQLDAAGPSLSAAVEAPTISVRTDVFDLVIDTRGAKLRDVQLLNYPVKKDRPDELVSILSDELSSLDLIQSGLVGAGGAPAPNHEQRFAADAVRYELADGQNQLQVALTWQGANGVVATKTFTFYRGRYNIDVELDVVNRGQEPYAAAPYVQVQRKHIPIKRSMFDVDSYSFLGSVVFDGEAADKYKHKELVKEPLNFATDMGWIATIEHHFLSAVIPPSGVQAQYSSRVSNDDRELISAVMPVFNVAPGASASTQHTVFVGPKLQEQLNEVAPGLVRTVDYGILSVLSQPLFWLLQKIHSLVQNWGLAIILMTFLIKLIFYPLAQKSGHSMAKMRNLAPRVKKLQERYKDDRQAMSREMMNIYKTEGVNPMSSCLPLLLQMPVFLALYWVLIESVELRQAPFALWINDLSSRDPLFILPLIMAVAMFIQTKLNPPPADPTTATEMMVLPLMMSVFFAFFPAGLVLYWVVNTVLSVLQQWRINRTVEAAAKA
ncbi:MAG: membrane protein insertase YidC [Gammaproteobacteria bacterium]